MSRSDPVQKLDQQGSDTRFRREALAVLGVLVLLTLGSIFLHSEAGWRWSALSSSRRDLLAGLTGSVRPASPQPASPQQGRLQQEPPSREPPPREEVGVLVGTAASERHTARLPLLELEPGATYLLTVRAGPGGTFTIQGFERRSKESVHLHFPYRRQTETYERRIGFGSRPAELRLTLVLAGSGPLAVEELALSRISPLARPSRRALPWVGLLVAVGFAWRHRRRLRAALTAEARPLDDAVIAGVLFVLAMAAFLAAPVQQVMDSRLSTLVSHSVIHDGSLALPDELVLDAHGGYRLLEIGGRLYHYAYTPVAVLNAPFVWLFERLGVSPVEGGIFEAGAEIGILRWIAALLAALLVGVLYRLARLWLAPLPAIGLSTAFAFGTQIFSTVSRPYWSHAWAILLGAVGIYLLLEPRHRDRLGAVLAATVLLLAACLCRPVMGLSAVGAAALCWVRPRSRWRAVPAGMVVFLAATSVVAFVSGGISRLLPGTEIYLLLPSLGEIRYLATGFLGTLASPARGLILYVPMFAWILWVTASRRRRLVSPGVAGVAAAVVAVHWAALVVTGVWADGQAYGPRLFSDVLVWFLLLGAIAMRGVLDAPPSRRRRLEMGAALILAGLSIFVNVRGATSPETWHWHWLDRRPGWMIAAEPPRLLPPRAWNWRNPQFLAGILPPEPGFDERREGLSEEQEF